MDSSLEKSASRTSISDKGEALTAVASLHDVPGTASTPVLLSSSDPGSTSLEGEKEHIAPIASTGEPSPSPSPQEHPDDRILTGTKLVLAFSAMLLSVFLIALDQTIVATALPVIASDFHALDSLTWIVSAYFVTQAPLILVYGQVLTIFPTKWVFLTAVTLFEVGSLICGVAQSAEVLIFGRAFAGVGAAGIFVAILSIIAEITRLEDRPKLFGLFGAVFAISSVIGPLLGGVFTEKATWRWCFLINLPIGAITIVAIIFIIKASPPPGVQSDTRTPLRRFLGLDWIGSILILGVTTCLILALQEGGITKPWNAPSVIAELVVFSVVLIIFVCWEMRAGSNAILPIKLFTRRSIVGACVASFFLMMVMLSGTYYLPLFYQAVKEHTPTKSGVDILPFMLAVVFFSMGAGGIISWKGDYWPFLVFGPLITPIGAGLLYAVQQDTASGYLIGAQICLGGGIGLAFQNTVISVQADLHDTPDRIPQGTALATFFQLIGGVVGISISGTLFNNQLAKELGKRHVSTEIVDAVKITVQAIFVLPAELKATVLDGYVRALAATFVVAIPAAILASVASVFIRRINLKKAGIDMAAGGAA